MAADWLKLTKGVVEKEWAATVWGNSLMSTDHLTRLRCRRMTVGVARVAELMLDKA